MGLMKNEFTSLFLKYVLKGVFPFGIVGTRFEQTLTKKSLNISAMQFYLKLHFHLALTNLKLISMLQLILCYINIRLLDFFELRHGATRNPYEVLYDSLIFWKTFVLLKVVNCVKNRAFLI